jgi:hypothetical protein
MRTVALPLLSLLLSGICIAQTTTTYQASHGTVSPGNEVKATLDLGGSFDTVYGFGGPNCYYGTCDMPFSGHPFNYVLPDGTAATLTNFAGTADFRVQADVKIQGQASGFDSAGVFVTVQINIDFAARCRSGRGGGCTKVFLDGTLNVTK